MLKRKIISFVCVLIGIFALQSTRVVNARSIIAGRITVDNAFTEVGHIDNTKELKYNKYRGWRSKRGTYTFCKNITYSGLFYYYDRTYDVITLVAISSLESEYKDKTRYCRDDQFRHKQMSQGIKFNSDFDMYGDFSPKTASTCRTATTNFSATLSGNAGSNGASGGLSLGLSASGSRNYNTIEYSIVGLDPYGYKWNYKVNDYSGNKNTEAQSAFVSVVCVAADIESASSKIGKKVSVDFSYWTNYFLDLAGNENYEVSSDDATNELDLNQKIEYTVSI